MKPVLVFDTEVYRDYFLVAFRNLATGNVAHFERLPDQEIDAVKVSASWRLIPWSVSTAITSICRCWPWR